MLVLSVNERFFMTKAEQKFKGRLEEIKREVASLGEMRPGSITEQYNVCGNPDCRCKDKKSPQKHGPYFQLSYTFEGKGTSEFVRAEDVGQVRAQLADYKRFMALKDSWVRTSIALAKLRRKAQKSKRAKA